MSTDRQFVHFLITLNLKFADWLLAVAACTPRDSRPVKFVQNILKIFDKTPKTELLPLIGAATEPKTAPFHLGHRVASSKNRTPLEQAFQTRVS